MELCGPRVIALVKVQKNKRQNKKLRDKKKKQRYFFTLFIFFMKRLSILKQPLFSTINDHLIDYPTPSNLNYMWSFGSLAGLCLLIQIATGIFLAMHYTAHVDLAFLSVEHIMRDVEGGWLLRYMHANGASMFFLVVYMHIFRNLYYGSYASPRELVWIMGVIILLLMIITAFIGYVLPWGFFFGPKWFFPYN